MYKHNRLERLEPFKISHGPSDVAFSNFRESIYQCLKQVEGDSKITAPDCIVNIAIHSMSCENIIKTFNLEGF